MQKKGANTMNRAELGAWNHIISFPEEKWEALSDSVETAYATTTVYPPRKNLFAAFQATPPERVRVVILGQDPYHEPGQAHGLSFSVQPGVKPPKSLVNIYKELEADLGIPPAKHGFLQSWAQEGVLLLNSILTVEAHKAGSHKSFGWESFTDAAISATNGLSQPIAFLLWGNYSIKKAALIDTGAPRLVLTSPHPSPLSAYRGFFGSQPFSKINGFLREQGQNPVNWGLQGFELT